MPLKTKPFSYLLDLIGVRFIKSFGVPTPQSRTMNFIGGQIKAEYNDSTKETDISITPSSSPLEIVSLPASRTMLASDIGKEVLVPSVNNATIVYTIDATLFSTPGEWIVITMMGSGSLTLAEIDGDTQIDFVSGAGLIITPRNARAILEFMESGDPKLCLLTGQIGA